VTQAADAENGDQIARAGAAVPQRVEGGDARTEQRRRIFGLQVVGHGGERLERRNHVLGIAAVIGDAGNLAVLAGDEIAATAGVAMPAMTAVPAHADPHAFFQSGTSAPTASMTAHHLVAGTRGY
jgi:hypothetical protein